MRRNALSLAIGLLYPSVPCAIAVQMVLDGRISEKGILAPMDEELAAPLREELKSKWGIEMLEKTVA